MGFGLFPISTFSVSGIFFSGNFGFRSLYSLDLWNRKATIVSIHIYRLFVSWPQPRIFIFLGGAKTEKCCTPQTTGRRIEKIVDGGVEISKNRICLTSRNRRRGGRIQNRSSTGGWKFRKSCPYATTKELKLLRSKIQLS